MHWYRYYYTVCVYSDSHWYFARCSVCWNSCVYFTSTLCVTTRVNGNGPPCRRVWVLTFVWPSKYIPLDSYTQKGKLREVLVEVESAHGFFSLTWLRWRRSVGWSTSSVLFLCLMTWRWWVCVHFSSGIRPLTCMASRVLTEESLIITCVVFIFTQIKVAVHII